MGAIWDHFCVSRVTFGVILGVSWAPLGSLGRLLGSLGLLGASLEPLGEALGHLWAVFGGLGGLRRCQMGIFGLCRLIFGES